MVGVVLVFFFGFPQPDFTEGVGLEDGTEYVHEGKKMTVKEYSELIARKKYFYKCMAITALVVMFIGFALQLTAACMTS